MYIYIRRPLPELERARLQLQPSNTILQAAAPTILQTASYYAAGCRIQPTLHHLKGVALIRHSPPQPATGCHRRLDLEPPPPPPGLGIGAPTRTGVPNSLLWLPW